MVWFQCFDAKYESHSEGKKIEAKNVEGTKVHAKSWSLADFRKWNRRHIPVYFTLLPSACEFSLFFLIYKWVIPVQFLSLGSFHLVFLPGAAIMGIQLCMDLSMTLSFKWFLIVISVNVLRAPVPFPRNGYLLLTNSGHV